MKKAFLILMAFCMLLSLSACSQRAEELQQREEEAQRKEEELQKREASVSQKEQEVERRKTEVQRREIQANQREKDLQGKEAELSQREEDLRGKEAELSQREKDLQSKEAAIKASSDSAATASPPLNDVIILNPSSNAQTGKSQSSASPYVITIPSQDAQAGTNSAASKSTGGTTDAKTATTDAASKSTGATTDAKSGTDSASGGASSSSFSGLKMLQAYAAAQKQAEADSNGDGNAAQQVQPPKAAQEPQAPKTTQEPQTPKAPQEPQTVSDSPAMSLTIDGVKTDFYTASVIKGSKNYSFNLFTLGENPSDWQRISLMVPLGNNEKWKIYYEVSRGLRNSNFAPTVTAFDAENGHFSGSFSARFPSSTEVPWASEMSGTFDLRADRTTQAARDVQSNMVSSNASAGTGGAGATVPDTPETSFKIDRNCRTCGGSGVCPKCQRKKKLNGKYGYYVYSEYAGGNVWVVCPRCNGSGNCTVCNPLTGKVYP